VSKWLWTPGDDAADERCPAWAAHRALASEPTSDARKCMLNVAIQGLATHHPRETEDVDLEELAACIAGHCHDDNFVTLLADNWALGSTDQG
jgi:hypothetical protein